MKNSAKISILMSCYNHQSYVAQAIESVLKQTFQDWELLIIDDCSTDKTFEIIEAESKKNDKIKIFKNNKNRGMVINTNALINKSCGKYISIINSDDSWEPTKLEKQINFLENNEKYGACFTLANIVNEKGILVKKSKYNPFGFFDLNRHQWLNKFFYQGNSLCYPSAMIRKSCLKEVGYFNAAFVCMLDLEMWIRICLQGYEIKILNEALTNFRVIKNQNLSGIEKPDSVRIRNHLEGEQILFNYCNIKNIEEFKKIFPNYEITSKTKEIWMHLFNLCIKSFFTKTANQENIKNFALQLLHQKSFENKNVILNLEENFSYNFKNHLKLTSLYPNGFYKIFKRKIKNIKYFLAAFLLILIIFIIK